MSQQPTVTVSIRLSQSDIAFLDEYRVYLARKRLTPVTRTDMLRMALLKLPLPSDAHPELATAHDGLAV